MGVYSAYIGPMKPEQKYLKFTSQQNGSKIGYRVIGSININIYISTDGKHWTSWDGSIITLNKGEKIYVWNKANTLSIDIENIFQFIIGSDLISASGNINSMINFTSLKEYCYYHIFEACTSLTTAPDLPATNLAQGCYEGMFKNCTSLTTAPDLPATTLELYCYAGMFENCTSLTKAPDLPATNLAQGCYVSMFEKCSSLNRIKLYYTGNFDYKYFRSWVSNVASSGTLYYNGSDTTRGARAIPTNFTVQTF